MELERLGMIEALRGGKMKDKDPKAYRQWLISKVKEDSSLEEMEACYNERFGALAVQGYYAFKVTGDPEVEKKFIKEDYPF